MDNIIHMSFHQRWCHLATCGGNVVVAQEPRLDQFDAIWDLDPLSSAWDSSRFSCGPPIPRKRCGSSLLQFPWVGTNSLPFHNFADFTALKRLEEMCGGRLLPADAFQVRNEHRQGPWGPTSIQGAHREAFQESVHYLFHRAPVYDS